MFSDSTVRPENCPDSLDLSLARFREVLPRAEELVFRMLEERDSRLINKESRFNPLLESHAKMPEEGIGLEKLLNEDLYDLLTTGLWSNSSRYLGEIPGGGLATSAIAELLVSAANRWPGLSDWAPGLVEIEKKVILWMCDMFALPQGAGGILTSGGSLANLSAIHVARENKSADNFSSAVIYYSELAHASNKKAARIAGFRDSQLRAVPVDPQGKMNFDNLLELIDRDLNASLQPMMIIATGGSTYSGAVDPLLKIAKICRQIDAWFHVDAAWAGSFMLTDRGRKLLEGISEANSITFDPHKGFWTPWGCGSLLVQDSRTLQDAFFVEAGYLPMDGREDLLSNPANISSELSRNSRGLQVWLPIMASGVSTFRKCLDEKIDLAEFVASEIVKIDGMKVALEPSLGIVNLSFEPDNIDNSQYDILNHAIVQRVNQTGEIYISENTIGKRLYIHIAPLHHRTSKDIVIRAVELIKIACDQLRAERLAQ